MKSKKHYEAPVLTVVTFQMERGYSSSLMLGLSPGEGDQSIEQRQDGGNWGGNDGWI